MLRDLCIDEKQLELEIYDLKYYCNHIYYINTFIALNKLTKSKFVIMIYDIHKYDYNFSNFIYHINILNALYLPTIVKFLGYLINDTKDDQIHKIISNYIGGNIYSPKELIGPIIFTEFLKNGNISSLIKECIKNEGENCQKINPTIRSKIIFGIAATMKQIHAKKVIHRNLTLDSVYLDDNLEPKIGDFYYSTFNNVNNDINDILWMNEYNIIYKSPEMLTNGMKNVDFSTDVYSFGMILYKMFDTGNKPPLCYLSPHNESPRKYSAYANFIKSGQRVSKSESIPDAYWSLIEKCWKQDPKERPTFAEITDILIDDRFALEEFGMKTNLNDLHEYQKRINIL